MSTNMKDGIGRDPFLWNESLYFDNPNYRSEEANRKEEQEYEPEEEDEEDEEEDEEEKEIDLSDSVELYLEEEDF